MRINIRRLHIASLATLACLGLLGANGCPPETIQETKLLASDGFIHHRFGFSVSVSGDVAVVGDYQDDDNGYLSGSAYVFSSLADTPECRDGFDNDRCYVRTIFLKSLGNRFRMVKW